MTNSGAHFRCVDVCLRAPCISTASADGREAQSCTVATAIPTPQSWPLSQNDIDAARVCRCREGFVLTDDGDCAEVDACATAPCDENAFCRDNPPPAGAGVDGRTCVCQNNFRGNGEICIADLAEATVQPASSTGQSGSNDSSSLWLPVIAAAIFALILVGVALACFVHRRQMRYDATQGQSLHGAVDNLAYSTEIFPRAAQHPSSLTGYGESGEMTQMVVAQMPGAQERTLRRTTVIQAAEESYEIPTDEYQNFRSAAAQQPSVNGYSPPNHAPPHRPPKGKGGRSSNGLAGFNTDTLYNEPADMAEQEIYEEIDDSKVMGRRNSTNSNA